MKRRLRKLRNCEVAERKGFDWECLNWYSTKGNLYHYTDSFEIDLDGITELCSAPTLQVAMKWLREKGIIISISYVRRNLQAIGSQMVFEFKIQNADGELLLRLRNLHSNFMKQQLNTPLNIV